MTDIFADHFAPVAAHYATFRPHYPAALFAWLANLAPDHVLAWDCAAGSGQASADLAAHFDRVVATDASASQIAVAAPHPQVDYRVASAEASGLPTASVDLITVAQALHWFDLDRFYAEVRRVLKPGGVLAVWSYGVLTVAEAAVNSQLQRFYQETVGPYWPPERRHVENGYQSLPFPFPELQPPAFAMEASWTLPELLGYCRSWSASERYHAECGHDPVIELAAELTSLWRWPNQRQLITWPLALRVAKKPTE
ncbi:MAG: class I SAM-dependent methyltransferase [Candidatus Contendobacter sp.]|nr:class I SAM-dependent methyltransferase [Candidatus Contendobacter sp.]